MKGKSRRPGPLLKKLRGLNTGGLGEGQVPTELPHGEEPSNLAFCPLLLKYAGKGKCGKVDCGNCDLPMEEYGDLEIAWLCSVCSDKADELLPYHGDGKCTMCGFPSSVLLMCVVGD